MTKENSFECEDCDKSFDTERGLHVHSAKMHQDVEKKKTDLRIMELLKKDNRNIEEISREIGKSKEIVEQRIEELMEKEWVQKKVESGKEIYYDITELGEEVVVPLMKDILEETKSCIEGVSEAFKKRLGPKLPKITVEWPEEEE